MNDASTLQAPAPYAFRVGAAYTRAEIFRLVGLSPEPTGGPWFTGYTDYGGDTFIFCHIGGAGRTGHDYGNHFDGSRLVWRGKGPSRLGQPSIDRLLDPARRIYLFHRVSDRAPFTFGGLARAEEWFDEKPVKVIWRLEWPENADIKVQPPKGRLPASDLNRVSRDQISRAVDRLLTENPQHNFSEPTDYYVVARGRPLPPKAVFGLALSEALAIETFPYHFSGGVGTPCFRAILAAGYPIIPIEEFLDAAGVLADPEERKWVEGYPQLISHLKKERARGLSDKKKRDFIRNHGRLFCEKCLMDPREQFGGVHGDACIEVHHHATQVSDMQPGHETTLEDLQCLCANCHRVEHKLLRDAEAASRA